MAEGEGQRKRVLWGLAGVTFPLTGAAKIASEIAQTKVPPQAETEEQHHAYAGRRNILDALRKGDDGPLRQAHAEGAWLVLLLGGMPTAGQD